MGTPRTVREEETHYCEHDVMMSSGVTARCCKEICDLFHHTSAGALLSTGSFESRHGRSPKEGRGGRVPPGCGSCPPSANRVQCPHVSTGISTRNRVPRSTTIDGRTWAFSPACRVRNELHSTGHPIMGVFPEEGLHGVQQRRERKGFGEKGDHAVANGRQGRVGPIPTGQQISQARIRGSPALVQRIALPG